MQLSKPVRYWITLNSERITSVKGPAGESTFVSPATNQGPKLYVVSDGENPVYVGGTKQPIRNRLRLGFQANGSNGYRGYLWRHYLREAAIDIWLITVEHKDIRSMKDDPSIRRAMGNKERLNDIVIETLEAEVVLLIHQAYGHWPEYQSEIHFHQSQDTHRDAARKIVSYYRSAKCPTS
jgi:hypothetical protein